MSFILYYYRNGYYSEAVRGFFRYIDGHRHIPWLRVAPFELPTCLKKFDLGIIEDYMCCYIYKDSKYEADTPPFTIKIGGKNKEAIIQKLTLDPNTETELSEWFNHNIELRRKKLNLDPDYDYRKHLEQEIVGDLRETTKNIREQTYDKVIRKYAYIFALHIEDYFDHWLLSHRNEAIRWARAMYKIDNKTATMFDKMTRANFDSMLQRFYNFEYHNWFDTEIMAIGKKADDELQETYRELMYEHQIPYALLEKHVNHFDIRNYMWENVKSRYTLTHEYYQWLASMKNKIMPWRKHVERVQRESQIKPKPVVVPLPPFMKKK